MAALELMVFKAMVAIMAGHLPQQLPLHQPLALHQHLCWLMGQILSDLHLR